MTFRKIFICISLVYCLGFMVHAVYLHKTVYGDGVYYYSWLRSIVFDRDINFTNEFVTLGGSQPVTAFGLPGNKYTIGPALLWLPGYLWIRNIVQGTGYEYAYQFITGLESVLYCLVGLLLLYRLLIRYFSKSASVSSVLGIAGATNLLFYGSLDTVNSHALSFFAATVFLSLLFTARRNWFAIGIFLGLIGLIRTQDFLFGLLVIPIIRKESILPFAFGVLLMFFPQLLAWQLVYGKFWTSPYLSQTEGFNFLKPHIAGVLFSPVNGLYLYTPVTLLGVTGLIKKHVRLPTVYLFVLFCLHLYLVSSWSTWWQGASYSGRMFVGILPIIAIGLANFFHVFFNRFMRPFIMLFAIVLPLSLINGFLILSFLLTK